MQVLLPVQQEKTSTPVTTLMLYVTEQCNLRCSYCFVNKQPRHLSIEKARQAVDFYLRPDVSGDAPSLLINFFGGEPFLRPDVMLDTIRYARARAGDRIHFAATTNGTLASPAIEQVIEEGDLSLLISLDGGAESHLFRPTVGGKNSYPQLERTLKTLLEWAPRSVIRMTFHPGSFNLLDKVLAAQQLGAPWISLCGVPEADWAGHEAQLEQESARLADWFIQEVRSGRLPPLEMHWRFLRDLLTRQGRPDKACGLGTTLLAVDTAGNVLPCHRYLYRKQEHLGQVARAPDLAQRRQSFVELPRAEIPDCSECIARSVCGGGCRVVAQECGYGLLGVHPHHCLLTRAHVRQVQRIIQQFRDDSSLLNSLQHFLRTEIPDVIS